MFRGGDLRQVEQYINKTISYVKSKDKLIEVNAQMLFTDECMPMYALLSYHDDVFLFTSVERTKHWN